MRGHIISLCILLGTTPALAGAARPSHSGADGHDHAAPAAAWTSLPVIVPAPARAPDSGTAERRPRRDRLGAVLTVQNLDAGSLETVAPTTDAAPAVFPLADGRARITPAAPDAGNYYWVRARQLHGNRLTVASTVWYFPNPGPAPTRLLQREKSELEIVPQPLPREHSSYREDDARRFLVRFEGRPLAGANLLLETENGSKAALTADASGIATVKFPRDFPPDGEEHGAGHHMGAPTANFVLAAEHKADGRSYLTTFNYKYASHPATGRSYWAGVGFGVLGMLLAAPLLRRRADAGDKKKG